MQIATSTCTKFSIINLVFLARYYSSPYSALYFLAAPRANQRERKITRSEDMKERPDHADLNFGFLHSKTG